MDLPGASPGAAPSSTERIVHQIPAFLPCHPKDLPTLPFCVESLRGHPQIGAISVVARRSLEPHCERLGVRFVDELSLLAPWFPVDHLDQHYGERRWYYQMFLKLSLAFAGEMELDRYLVMDSDTVLLHPFPLIDERSGEVLHPRLTKYVAAYMTGIRELLGHDVVYDGSYTSHLMVFRAPIVREMFAEFARVKDRPPEEGREVLREYLQTCDTHTRSLSDYEIYGYFTRECFPEELRWANRRQLNALYIAPYEDVLKRLRPYYDYCSFHAYRRPNTWPLRVAGASWLRLRLLRDRLAGRSRCA
jgi:hypothetical protein